MWPTLFRIPLPEFLKEFLSNLFGHPITGIPIHSFGLMVMTGFLVGLWYGMRLAKKYGNDPEKDPQKISDLAFWLLIGIIFGGRLLYVIVHNEQFADNPFRILAFWEGGMVFYGGFIACFALGLWKAKQYKLEIWNMADYMMVAGMLGYGIGRWGCLLVGDDYGKETTVPWALHIPDPLPADSLFPATAAGKYLHPTQLYMSANGFLIAGIARWILSRRKFKGQVCWSVFLLYGIGRFIIEFFRGDDVERGIYGAFSTSQWISMFLIIIASLMLWSFSKSESRRIPAS